MGQPSRVGRFVARPARDTPASVRRWREPLLLVGVLVVATLLRLHELGDELWVDEIVTWLRVSRLDAAAILTTYESQNQHLLYSLLARGALLLFGDTPAALRAPAAAFGVLSIAALYPLGRDLLSRREALLAAALLAVSEQHVWFSQNARGYSALLFFTLLSSWLLLRALADDRPRRWIAWAVATTLGLAVHLTMLFVVGAHLVMVLRRRVRQKPRVRRSPSGPLLGFGLAAALTLLVYAPIVPQILAVNAVEGRSGSIPEWSSSGWAASEVLHALNESFPHPLLAASMLVIGLVGAWTLRRRAPVLLELLALPIAIGMVVVLGSGHTIWPRLFFFAIGFAALTLVAGAVALGERCGRGLALEPSRITAAGTLLAMLLIAAAATGLPKAYGPKQNHAAALALIDAELRPGDAVVTAGLSVPIVQQYYGRDWARVETGDELARVRQGATRTWLVHSLPIHLHARRPEIASMLERDFVLIARFPGTLRGGDVLVWRSDHPPEVFTPAPR